MSVYYDNVHTPGYYYVSSPSTWLSRAIILQEDIGRFCVVVITYVIVGVLIICACGILTVVPD